MKLIIFFSLFSIFLLLRYEHFFCVNEVKKIIYKKEIYNSYKIAWNKAKDFINNTINGVLMNNNKTFLSIKPEISAVIPCYNCRDYILRSVRSIQNQNFSNFEIVIGDDYSDINTLLFLEQLKKEDSRIRIINNKKNMGTLYTRTISTLASRGKYIFPIDSDDMFLDKDVFFTIVNIAKISNIDIIIFNSIISDLKPNIFLTRIFLNPFEKAHKPNTVLFQPDLGYYPIIPKSNLEGVNFNEELIFAKCIRTKIYKKAINKLGKERYSRFMVLGEDDIANYIIFNTAKIGKFIPKYGYIYVKRKTSISKGQFKKVDLLLNFIYILDVVIEFSINLPKNKSILINLMFNIFKKKYLKNAIDSNEYNNKIFFSCLDRILKCNFIPNVLKNKIKNRVNSLGFIKYKF